MERKFLGLYTRPQGACEARGKVNRSTIGKRFAQKLIFLHQTILPLAKATENAALAARKYCLVLLAGIEPTLVP